MEQTLTGASGNIITLKYDESTDTVSVKNTLVGDSFMNVLRNDAEGVDPHTLMIEGYNISNWDDEESRVQLFNFWEINKINK